MKKYQAAIVKKCGPAIVTLSRLVYFSINGTLVVRHLLFISSS
jgi:hypothetical protein